MRDPLPQCGIRENLPADRIFWGWEAVPHSWPWMVALKVNIVDCLFSNCIEKWLNWFSYYSITFGWGPPGTPLRDPSLRSRRRSYIGEVFHLCSIVRRCHTAKRADLQAHNVCLWFTLYLLSFSGPMAMEVILVVGSSSTDTLLQAPGWAPGNTHIHNHEI